MSIHSQGYTQHQEMRYEVVSLSGLLYSMLWNLRHACTFNSCCFTIQEVVTNNYAFRIMFTKMTKLHVFYHITSLMIQNFANKAIQKYSLHCMY